MTREQVLIVLGILVLISPWSGLPLYWLTWVLLAIGLLVVGIGVTLHLRKRQPPPRTEPPVRIESAEPQSRSSHVAFS